ncbi:hypothetical protein [Legionella longbeachae]|uniref:Symporter n=2 Tax=Legionella longbeachae TaxID=450 RepID=D3HSQ5_LEGLN|nr:hypothetical protein [Legionella longbeachae]CBJ11944.1 hypothetical protein LLO_1576 [Legionella longbeachae NSW150]VEE02439.1 symporter [Legionella oakridgensis]
MNFSNNYNTYKLAKQLITRVEKLIKTTSEPALVRRILSELHLNELETTNKEYTDFIGKISTVPMQLTPLINYLNEKLIDNTPICQLFAFIEKNELISNEELEQAAKTIQLQITLLSILEAIIVTMTNGEQFAQDVYQHLSKRSGSPYPGNPVVDFFWAPSNASLFERIKLSSIKPGMLNILFHRAMKDKLESQSDIEQFISKMGLWWWYADIRAAADNELTGTTPAMALNIMEAAWEESTGDVKHICGKDNAEAGALLIKLMEEHKYSTSNTLKRSILPENTVLMDDSKSYSILPGLTVSNTPKKVMEFNIDGHWRDLYNSWNLLFVITNIDKIFMPIKLILPTVLAAEPQNYKEVRVISLFTIGSIFLQENTKMNPFFSDNYHFKNAEIILKKWGEINKDYGMKLLKHQSNLQVDKSETSYHEVFGNNPHLNFLIRIIGYLSDPSNYQFTQPNTAKFSSRFSFFSQSKQTSTSLSQVEHTSQAHLLSI